MCTFLEGTKPATLTMSHYYKTVNGKKVATITPYFEKLKKRGYPYILFRGSRSVLVFQNLKLLQKFRDGGGYFHWYSKKKNKWVTYYRQDKIGEALGMPKSATKFFVEHIVTNTYSKEERVFFTIGELTFATHIKYKEETLGWLRKTYDVEYPITVKDHEGKKTVYYKYGQVKGI